MSNHTIGEDLKSSIVVFLVALPLCLGIALASGAPLISGLIAGILGGIVVGSLSNSQVSVSGPAAGLTVIVAGGITQVGGMQAFALVVACAGIIQIIFGLVKGGQIGDYFPASVIKGMLAAIGLILIIKQTPGIFGQKKWSEITDFHQGVLIISVVSFFILLTWDNVAKKLGKLGGLIPAPLIAVIVSVIINSTWHLVDSSYLVTIPSDILSGIQLPDWGQFNGTTLSLALTIAVIASLESLLSINAADKMDPAKRKTNKNRELFAQGMGNFCSGLIGGLPLTAVIVRTTANVNAGAKSKFSAVFHGFWLVICVLLIPNILNLIPLATLACVLILVGYKLIKPQTFIEMYKRGSDQLVIYITTIAAIVMTDLLKGIFVGLVMAFVMEYRKFYLKTFDSQEENKTLVIKFNKDLSFFHRQGIAQHFENPLYEKVILRNYHVVKKHIDIVEMVSDYQRESDKIFIEN